MSFAIRSGAAAVLLAVLVIPGQAWAEGPGQEDLDRARELKLDVKTVRDLTEVIRLLRSSLEKGLDEEHVEFARSLLAGALIQRGSSIASLVIASSLQDPDFMQHRKTSLDDLEEAIRLRPGQPEALYLIARLNLLAGGDADRASEALDRAIELSADEPRLQARALLLRASVEDDPEKKAADLDEAVRIAPDDSDTLRARGLLWADMGESEKALADLDKVVELEPTDAAAHLARAAVLTQLKKYDEALVSLDRVHELRPDSVIPLLQMAQIHSLQENLPAAIHELNRAHSMDPENVVVLLARAEVYRENGQQEKALADVDAALKLSPHLPGAMLVRASLLADAGRHDEAITELEALRQQEPGDLLALLQLGMLYAAEEMYDRTVEVFSAVLAQRPNALIALRGRGDALLNLGRHQQAIADYEALMKAEPDDPGTLNNLAWVLATSPYGRLRNGKRAVALATQACELTDYQAAYILSTLAAAYAETGDFQAAVQWIEKGLEVAEEELTEPLKEELQSYRNHLPWRELLTAQSQDHSPP